MAHYQIIGKAMLPAGVASDAPIRELRTAFLIRRQRQRRHQARDVDPANQRMLSQLIQRLFQRGGGDVSHMVDDVLFLHDAQVFQRHGGTDRVTGIGVAMVEFAGVDDLGHFVTDNRPANRRVARAEALGDGHDMRLDPHGLRAEPVPCPAKATDHLVGDQQNVVFVANALNLGPVGAGRNDNPAGTLHGFGNEGGNLVRA